MAEQHAAEGGGDNLGSARLVTGLAQGLMLYGLYVAGESGWWPLANAEAYAALALVLLFVPLLAIQGIGGMRPATLLAWCAAAAALLAGAGAWNRYALGPAPDLYYGPLFGQFTRYLPSAPVVWLCALALFVGHALVTAADRRRQLIAPYDSYFAVSWKLGAQAVLTVGFVLAFWLVLVVARALYGLLLGLPGGTVAPALFIPLTAMAAALALHLTERRADLVAGLRGLVLELLAWLLPLAALVAAAFLIGLLFVGLSPLWQTGRAAALLLAAALGLILLVNAAWQEGPEGHAAALTLRTSGTLAALLLVPLVGLAVYALGLRVQEYGWSVRRVELAAALTVAATYALGYGWAALGGSILRHRWLAGLARVNIAGAFVLLAVIAAILSPLADPMRIAAASQLARIEAQRSRTAFFDIAYLDKRTGRFGRAALQVLARRRGSAADARIAAYARATLTGQSVVPSISPAEIRRQIKLYPADYPFPESLLTQEWQKQAQQMLPPCLTAPDDVCEVFPLELTGAPPDQLLFVWPGPVPLAGAQNAVLEQDGQGHWRLAGRLDMPLCPGTLAAMRAGRYAVVAPLQHRFRDIEANGVHFTVLPPLPAWPCR